MLPEQSTACERFYAILGFTRVAPPPSLAGRALWLERDGFQIHLIHNGGGDETGDLAEARPHAATDLPIRRDSHHIALVVDPYDATIERLRAAGHAPATRAEHWGSARCKLTDPAGNAIELMASPPA